MAEIDGADYAMQPLHPSSLIPPLPQDPSLRQSVTTRDRHPIPPHCMYTCDRHGLTYLTYIHTYTHSHIRTHTYICHPVAIPPASAPDPRTSHRLLPSTCLITTQPPKPRTPSSAIRLHAPRGKETEDSPFQETTLPRACYPSPTGRYGAQRLVSRALALDQARPSRLIDASAFLRNHAVSQSRSHLTRSIATPGSFGTRLACCMPRYAAT